MTNHFYPIDTGVVEEQATAPSTNSSFIGKFFSQKRNIVGFVIIIALVAAIPLGVYLVQQQQVFKPKASETQPASGPETSFSLRSNAISVAPGSQVRVSVYARSDVDAANLFAAKLKFPTNLLKVTAINTSSASAAVAGVSIAQACVQIPTVACSPTNKLLCYEYATPCDVPVGWTINNNAIALPTPTPARVCAQVITRACSPTNTADCRNFATPCDVPAGWIVSPNQSLATPTPTGRVCAQVVTRACSPTDPSNCKDFATPCDVPAGWIVQNRQGITIAPTKAPAPVNTDYFIRNWVEKTYDNTAGTVSLIGGLPTPGFQTKLNQPSRVMAEVVFTALASGDATISFADDSAIYRNSDNQNILNIKRDVVVKISSITPTPTGLTPTPVSSQPSRRAFVTSTTYNGNLGGLSGADAKCQERANAANLGGTWKAWLNNTTDRFTHSTGAYKNMTGNIIANNWSDLTDGTIENTITVDENRAIRAVEEPFNVWTNTWINGYGYEIDWNFSCADWTSSSSSMTGIGGASWKADSYWTLAGTQSSPVTASCNSFKRLYCFEQGSSSTSTSTTSTGIRGDVNVDQKVTLADMSALLSKFGQAVSGGADLNSDNAVNSLDYSVMRSVLVEIGLIKGE